MRAAQLIAMSGRPVASYVGDAAHTETQTIVPLPAAAKAGDLAIIIYLKGRVISGGSGNPWTVRATTGSLLGVAYKLLEAGDISNPMNFHDVTNVITMVVRGPRSLSVERTGVNHDEGSEVMAGFTKSPTCMGLYSAAYSQIGNPSVVIAPGDPNPFVTDSEVVGPESFGLQARLGLVPSIYVGDVFVTSGGPDAGAGVFELLL